MEKWFTAQQIADLNISILPNTKAGVIYRAKKDGWINRKRTGKGGGLEYAFSGLPREVQIEIETQVTKALILASKPTKKAVAIKQGRDTKTLSHKDRRCVDNRLLMALLVEQYTLELGNQDKALKFISSLSRNNALPTIGGTDYNVVCANAKASNHGTGVGVRKLHEWVLESKRCHTPTERLSMLAPAKQGRPKLDVMRIGWLPDFLAVYRNPNGLPFSKSYQIFAVNYVNVHGKDTLPSLNQVRKALNELPPVVRERGRKTGSQLKALDAYIQRDWNAVHIKNNSVWVGDGHSLKLKVRHPKSGAGFTPELTVIMDAPSRYIVGFSLSYSESGFAVLDALKMGIQNHGVPAIYYSDNGSGQFNEMLDNEITGILPRLGITHKTGIPGNPQGRGIIERFMKEVPKMIAQSFDSYYGKDGDQDTVRQRLKAMQSHAKALTDGKVSGQFSPLQQRADKILPTWDELYHTVKEAINWYNNEHRHRSIGQMTPSEKRSELDMLHGSERIWLNEMELKDLACPVFKRVVEDNASLKRLHDQIDKAKQKMVDFADNAKQTMQDLQSELAGLQGNDDEVRRLKHAQKLADLETKIAQAKTQGNSEALVYYQKALELQQKINTEENRQASTKASQSATQANTKDITFGTHQNPSSELSAKDIGDMWEKHLDGIKQEAKREARAEFIQEMQDDIKRRAR